MSPLVLTQRSNIYIVVLTQRNNMSLMVLTWRNYTSLVVQNLEEIYVSCGVNLEELHFPSGVNCEELHFPLSGHLLDKCYINAVHLCQGITNSHGCRSSFMLCYIEYSTPCCTSKIESKDVCVFRFIDVDVQSIYKLAHSARTALINESVPLNAPGREYCIWLPRAI